MIRETFALSLLLGCASPEPQLPPATAAAPASQHTVDTASASEPRRLPDIASALQPTLPSGYRLTDTTEWSTMLEDGQRAVLRRGAVTIDTVDLAFGVGVVGGDSLVFLPVRTDTVPLGTCSTPCFESFPTEHVFWTPVSRRELRALLPYFDAYFSIPRIARGSVIHYWGIAPQKPTNRLYAMRYDFRTAHLDSLFLNREDPLATDYRYHLGTPQIHGSEISFGGVVLDSAMWRVIRHDSLPN